MKNEDGGMVGRVARIGKMINSYKSLVEKLGRKISRDVTTWETCA